MKRVNLSLTILILFLGFSACKKDPLKEYSGTVTAFKNNVSWAPLIMGSKRDAPEGKFNLYINEYSGETRLSGLSITNIPYSGKYRIYKKNANDLYANVYASYYDTWDGHSICSMYDVIESDSISNFIEITNYDSRKKEIQGRFGLKLILTGSCAAGYSDTLHIKDAIFETKIK